MPPIDKKRKRPSVEPEAKAQASSATQADRPRIVSSLLRTEEAFPRGGGSSLTPLEYKQATEEAKREALFDEDDGQATASSHKKRQRKLTSLPKARKPASTRATGLSAKRLKAGTQILGQITSVNADDLVVALPNSLSGFVSLMEVSDELSARVAQGLEDDDDEEEEVPDIPSLRTMFSTGQWVRCAVLPSNAQDKNAKLRIDLTLKPSAVNAGLTKRCLQPHALVQASVRSVEDHGVITDIGVDGVTGFIKSPPAGMTVGQVVLCHVVSLDKSGKVAQLSVDVTSAAPKLRLRDIADVRALLPGDGIEVVITETDGTSFIGKAFGLQDVTCDLFHSRRQKGDKELKVSSKVTARVLFCEPGDERHVAVSVLPHIVDLARATSDTTARDDPAQALPFGTVVDQVSVTSTTSKLGLWCDVGLSGIDGFVHISRVSDEKLMDVDKVKVGSRHRARIVGYNPVDAAFSLSTEESVTSSKYFSTADLAVGQIVKATVERFVKGSLLVRISKTLTALVSDLHLADIQLQAPEKKFKAGLEAKGRVLSLDADRQRVSMTLKKSLLASDAEIITALAEENVGKSAVAVVTKLMAKGALVDFYNGVRAFLPASQMSEAVVSDPRKHFRLGQTLSVRVIEVDVDRRRMVVSCRSPAAPVDSSLELGSVVAGQITDKTTDRIVVKVDGQTNGIVELGHFADSDNKCEKLFDRARVGGHIKEAVVLSRNDKQGHAVLSLKPSLIKAAKSNTLLKSVNDAKVGFRYPGHVVKVYDYGVLVGFVGEVTALCVKGELADEYVSMPASRFRTAQSVDCTVASVDAAQGKILVSFKSAPTTAAAAAKPQQTAVEEVVQAKIIGTKQTQLNLELPDGRHGRVDVSSVYDDLSDIKAKRHPLKQFDTGDTIAVRIIGRHDARNHKFLPLTHRTSNAQTIYECSMRPSVVDGSQAALKEVSQCEVGQKYLGFVNAFHDDCVWVSLSPTVRGRLRLLDLAASSASPEELAREYVPGAALTVRITKVDAAAGRLDLSERTAEEEAKAVVVKSIDSLKVGMVLPGRVIKVSEVGVLVQLAEGVVGRVALTDIADEHIPSPESAIAKNSIVNATVVSVDRSNKRIQLSLRSENADATDPVIEKASDLTVGEKYRGYVSNVAELGLFVELGRTVIARVKIAETSDDFVKDWRSLFTRHQLVEGTVLSVDAKTGRVELTLKKGQRSRSTNGAQAGLDELEVGSAVDATVKNIETFGLFLQVDALPTVSGLCHRSEIADKAVGDIAKIYSIGDSVRAKVLDVDLAKQRVSFGLKASYFDDEADADGDAEMSDADESDDAGLIDDEAEEDDDEDDEDFDDMEEDGDDDDASDDDEEVESQGITTGGFDFSGQNVFGDAAAEESSDEEDDAQTKKPRKKNAVAVSERPQTAADFERLVLGHLNSSLHWLAYMAYHLEQSDVAKAREVAERALDAIHYRELTEKLNVHTALLNLEGTFGDAESLEKVFKRACAAHDPRDVHSRLVGVYIRLGRPADAEEVFKKACARFSSEPKVWIDYAEWLAKDSSRLEDARALLARSLKSIDARHHVQQMERFARLEYREGDAERGATLLEGILSSYPKRLDVWLVYCDQEIALALRQAKADGEDGGQLGDRLAGARKVLDRIVAENGVATKLTTKKAKAVFKKWLALEKEHGSEDDVARVKAKAVAFVQARQ